MTTAGPGPRHNGPLAGLDGARVVVEVPATTANLGAGYDCLGMALDLVDRVEVEVRSRSGVELTVVGEGEGELGTDDGNRVLVGLRAVIAEVSGDASASDAAGWRIAMTNRIPLARGLGSSAAATVAGLVAANELLGHQLGDADLLRLAATVEGHPDNAAPALLGGIVATAVVGDRVEAVRFDVPRGIRAVVLIPELRLSTAEMRRVLPHTVPHADAVANLGRVAVGLAGLAAGRRDVLRLLTEDRLHEPYRAAAYPQLPRLVADARAAGALGACLSGAGSAVVAFTDTVAGVARIEAAFRAAAADTDLPARVEVIPPRDAGAKVLERT